MLIHVKEREPFLLAVGLLCYLRSLRLAKVEKWSGSSESFRASAGGISIPSEGTILTGDVLRTTKAAVQRSSCLNHSRRARRGKRQSQFESLGDRVIVPDIFGRDDCRNGWQRLSLRRNTEVCRSNRWSGKSVYLVAVLPDDGAVVNRSPPADFDHGDWWLGGEP